MGEGALFHSFFPRMFSRLLNPTTLGGTPLSLASYALFSRIDRIFIHRPMAEGRECHCYSHVFENLGKRSIPSDHAAVRVVLHPPTFRRHQGKSIPSWMRKHPVFCPLLKRLDDDHQYSADPFDALADFRTIAEKVRSKIVRELSRRTRDSLGAKLLTAVHAEWSRGCTYFHSKAVLSRIPGQTNVFQVGCQLPRFLFYFEAASRRSPIFNWPVFSLEDFKLSFKRRSRQTVQPDYCEIDSWKSHATWSGDKELPWTQTEKYNALTKCRFGLRAWRVKKKTCFVSMFSLMKM